MLVTLKIFHGYEVTEPLGTRLTMDSFLYLWSFNASGIKYISWISSERKFSHKLDIFISFYYFFMKNDNGII